MEKEAEKQQERVSAAPDTMGVERANTMAAPPFNPSAGPLDPKLGTQSRDSIPKAETAPTPRKVPAGRLIAESVGKGGVNDALDVEAVLGRLVALKVISPQEAMKNCPADVAVYVLRYQGMISNRPGDGLLEAGKSTETNLILGKVTKAFGPSDPSSASGTEGPKADPADQAYWDMLKTTPADAAGVEVVLLLGNEKAGKAFGDLCKLKRWDMLWAIYQNQYSWNTDWMAREILKHLTEPEIAALPQELRVKIKADLGSGWVTAEETSLLEKMDKAAPVKASAGQSPAAKLPAKAGTAGVDVEARALALEKATEYVDKNPGKTYAFSSPPSPPGGKVDCSGLIRAAVMAAGYPDSYFDPVSGKQNPGVPMEDGTGTWGNGVALLVSHPNWVKKPLESVISGDMVTFRTDRDSHKGEDGKYDHIGIVNAVTLGPDGNVASFTFVHSSSSNGPAHGDYTIAKPPTWLKASGAYSWDNPVKK